MTKPKNPNTVINASELEQELLSNSVLSEIKEKKESLGSLSLKIDEVAKNLSIQQRAFLDKFAVLGDAKKACLEANLGTHPTSVSRYRALLNKPEARLYLEKIKDLGFVQAVLSIEEIIEGFRTIYKLAVADGDYKAANEALKALGVYKGMFGNSFVGGSNKGANADSVPSNSHTSGDKPSEIKYDIEKYKEILSKVDLVKQ